MENRRRIGAANGEIHLPEAIIQHIQSFLCGKEAARTSILSKSWYSAWSTRPNLDLDQRDISEHNFRLRCRNPKLQIRDGFPEFAMKTMQRYQDLNLKIESFRLYMKCEYTSTPELIVKAMKMGASDLNFQLQFGSSAFALPHEVLGSETLIRLSVTGCKIDLALERKVSCSRLKFLSLCNVYIVSDTLWDIVSSCPLIEELCLSECWFLFESQSSIVDLTTTRTLALSPFIEFGKSFMGLDDDCSIHVYEFHKLKRLFLEKVKIDTLFFRGFSSRFPCLKDLTLRNCDGYKGIQISSSSLECINFAQRGMLRVKFDVPNIRRITFIGSVFPSLSFKTASNDWESDISISWRRRPNASWFLKLNKFLAKLSLSRISLSLNIWFQKSFDFVGNIQGLIRPVLENLTINVPSSVCCALFDGLFWSCRPKFITQDWLPKSSIDWKTNNDMLEVLCKRLMQQVGQNCSIPNRSTFGECDPEEVNVELFEETVAEWRLLPWKTLLDASKIPKDKRKIRFKLRWR